MAPSGPPVAGKIAACLSQFSPVPAFPPFSGPYKVGTVDVEAPVAQLPAPSVRPAEAGDIPTIQFRVFYPAVASSDQPPVSWLPSPQRSYAAGYTTFLGVKPALADFLS